jgi:hypothetical protein
MNLVSEVCMRAAEEQSRLDPSRLECPATVETLLTHNSSEEDVTAKLSRKGNLLHQS